MKLATALSERADIQKKISELSTRLKNNAKVQEGEKPSEEPAALLAELDSCYARLEELIARINRTNNETESGGITISDLIAKRDCLQSKIGVMRDFLNESRDKVQRYSRAEIKITSTVEVAAIQKKVDALSAELRKTDETIQGLNWTTELI